MTASVTFVELAVENPARARDWQREALGACISALVLRTAHESDQRRLSNNEVGAVHICLRTSDIVAAYERLRRNGATFTTEPQPASPTAAVAYFRDPEGVQFQLLQLSSGPLAGGPAPRPVAEAVGVFHHVGVTVADVDVAVQWLGTLLGLTPVVRARASGPAAALMLGLKDCDYRAVVLTTGDQWLELMEFERPAGNAEPPASDVLDGHRICFDVDDPDVLEARIREHPAPVGVAVMLRRARR